MSSTGAYRRLCLLALHLAFLCSVLAAPNPLQRSNNLSPVAGKRTQVQTFCDKFRTSCRRTCLANQSGPQHIKFGCEKDSQTKSYEFLCECNGKVKTRTALNGVTGPKPVYTTVGTSTFTTISTVEIDQTSTTLGGQQTVISAETRTKTFSLSDKTITSTSTYLTTATQGVPGTRTVVDVTTTTPTSSYSRGIVTFPIVTSTTTTKTIYSLVPSQGQRVAGKAILRVATPQQGTGSVDDSTFCKGYSKSCDRTCARVDSTASETTCKRTDTNTVTRYYDLYCKCANGKVETSHALADLDGAIEGTSTISVTAVSTSTSFTSFTVVETVPVATSTITLQTTKSVVAFDPPTTTYSKTVGTSITKTTSVPTGATVTVQSTSTARTKVKTIVTTTITNGQTQTIRATTMVGIAPTGRVRLDNAQDGNTFDGCYGDSKCRTVGYLHSTDDGKRAGSINETSDALDFVLVEKPGSGSNGIYYALVDMDTGLALVPNLTSSQFLNEDNAEGKLLFSGTISQEEAAGTELLYWAWSEYDAQAGKNGGVQLALEPAFVYGGGSTYIMNADSWVPKIGAGGDPYITVGKGNFGKTHAKKVVTAIDFFFEFAGNPFSLTS